MRSSSTMRFSGRLHRVLSAHYKALVEAGSSQELLDDYLRLLRILRAEREEHADKQSINLDHHSPGKNATSVNISELLTVPLDKLEIVVQNGETPRGLLEGVAVQRFSVPKGSLRQYSNRQLLVEKLKSLIDNERTHNTIGEIARRHEP